LCTPLAGDQSDAKISINHKPENHQVEISFNKQIITIFHYHDSLEKPLFYPVRSLSGTRVNRAYPWKKIPGERTDHPHQVGIWFNFGDVNGFDFWNNSDEIPQEKKEKYGFISLIKIDPFINKDQPGFRTIGYWISIPGDTLLKEETRYQFSVNAQSWQMIRKTKLTAMQPVHLKDNKEGLFAIRVAGEFEMNNHQPVRLIGTNGEILPPQKDSRELTGNYLTSENLTGHKAWGTKAAWMCLNGIREGDSISIAIFDHPENFNHPPHWHARHYGLFSVNNLGQKSFQEKQSPINLKLETDEDINFRHQLIISHGGFLETNELKRYFQIFKKTQTNVQLR